MRQVATAAGVAAAIGTAQLGLGYGLGVVVWPVTGTADDSIWLGSLGWATWIAASSTVFGAVVASRLRARTGGPWRLALAASAAIGALLAVALIALPARQAVRPDTFSAETIAGGYATIGVLFGLVIAYWAVVSRPVAANLVATAAWLWALAVAAIVAELTLHRPSATYLTSWQFADPGTPTRYGTIHWPSALLTLLAALIIGGIGALPAVRRAELGIGTAASGAVGPLLVAAAFFVLAPQLTGALGPLESAYLIAPYGVLAGLAGSAATVALGQRVADRRRSRMATSERRSLAAAVPNQPTGAEPESDPAPTVAPSPASTPQSASPSRAVVPPSPTSSRSKPTASSRSKPTARATGSVPRPAAAPPNPTSSATKASSAAKAQPLPASPAGAQPPAPPASGKTAEYRSTVAPPPANPPVLKINPPRSGDSAPAKPSAAAAAQPAPAKSPAAKAADPAEASASLPAGSNPAKARPQAKSAVPSAPTPAKTTSARTAPSKAATKSARSTPPAEATPPGEATPPSKSTPPGKATTPSKAASAKSTPAKARPAKRTGTGETETTATGAAGAKPAKAQPATGSDEPTAELQVGEPGATPPPDQEENKRWGLRRFGRRSSSDDTDA